MIERRGVGNSERNERGHEERDNVVMMSEDSVAGS